MKKFDLNALLKVSFQFIKFGIVGVSNTAVSLFVYYFLIYFNVNYIIANTMGFIVSVINAFYWNKKFVFRTDHKLNNKNTFVKVFVSYGLTFLLNTLFLYLMVDRFHISSYIAPIINVIIITPINFLLNKFWAFKIKNKS